MILKMCKVIKGEQCSKNAAHIIQTINGRVDKAHIQKTMGASEDKLNKRS